MNDNKHGASAPGITYFICYKNYRRYLAKLRPDQVGALHLALYDFAFDGALTEFDDLAVELLYEMMTDQIRRDADQYMTKVENGRKGGRPRKDAAEKPKKTSETASESHSSESPKTEPYPDKTENNQEEEKEYEEEKENEEDKENEEEEENEKEYTFSSPSKEEKVYSTEQEEKEEEEYSEPVREQTAQRQSRDRLGAYSGSAVTLSIDEAAMDTAGRTDGYAGTVDTGHAERRQGGQADSRTDAAAARHTGETVEANTVTSAEYPGYAQADLPFWTDAVTAPAIDYDADSDDRDRLDSLLDEEPPIRAGDILSQGVILSQGDILSQGYAPPLPSPEVSKAFDRLTEAICGKLTEEGRNQPATKEQMGAYARFAMERMLRSPDAGGNRDAHRNSA